MKLIFCNRGVALTELALILPILVLIIIGTVETGRYAVAHIKLDRTAATLTDLLSQQQQATAPALNQISIAAEHIMKPFDFRNGTIIFSSVYTSNGEPIEACSETTVNCIVWQYRSQGNGSSQLGEQGTITYLPGGYNVPIGQSVVVVEVMLEYQPMLRMTGEIISALRPQTLYKYAIFKPRLGNLLNPPR